MSDPINTVTASNQPVSQATAPTSADPTTAAAAMSTNATGEATGSTTISSLDDLKTKAPKVYYQMMVSIATSMISAMHQRDEHLKEIWRKAREDESA